MKAFWKNTGPGFVVFAVLLLATSCATQQGRFSRLAGEYPSRPDNAEVQVFRQGLPPPPFIRISRLDVHLERTGFSQAGLENALPELKHQARLSGAEAIIEIQETVSSMGETRIYHVTATGIRFNQP